MPIEIKELHIKIKVNEREPTGQALTTSAARDQERGQVEGALLQETIEQVLQVLKDKKER
jgi:Family of unknown function (DUF5908)